MSLLYIYIKDDRHDAGRVVKKKYNSSLLLDLPCVVLSYVAVTESEPPAMVNSGFLDHKPDAAER